MNPGKSRAVYFQNWRKKIKHNPVGYEERKAKERQRWLNRRANGKVKLVSELSDRSLRAIRKTRRESSGRNYRKKKETLCRQALKQKSRKQPLKETPCEQPSTKQKRNGRKFSRREDRVAAIRIKEANSKVTSLESQLAIVSLFACVCL